MVIRTQIVFRLKRRHTQSGNRSGMILPFIAIGIIMLLAMTMISVDVAYMQLVRTELRAASDAAAKAGAEALARTQTTTAAVTAAMTMAELNTVAGKPLKLKSSNVIVGTTTLQPNGGWTFASGGTKPNSVRISLTMNMDSATGPVDLMFGRAFKAGAFTPSEVSTASAVQQEICLAIDRSASMSFDLTGAEWAYPRNGEYDRRPVAGSRWASLQTALELFLTEVRATAVPSRVALVTWASDMTGQSLPRADNTGFSRPTTSQPSYSTTTLESDLSHDFTTLNSKLAQRSEWPIYGGTNMAAGIDRAVQVLTASNVLPFAQRTIVLMTDGQWNTGRNPLDAARAAQAAGIRIHVVTFLSGGDSSDAASVASITGGTYINARSSTELSTAFQKLARTLPVVLTE